MLFWNINKIKNDNSIPLSIKNDLIEIFILITFLYIMFDICNDCV